MTDIPYSTLYRLYVTFGMTPPSACAARRADQVARNEAKEMKV